LRRAEQAGVPLLPAGGGESARSTSSAVTTPDPSPADLTVLDQVEEISFNPAPESHLLRLDHPQETPSEEFRSLRTKLNHMQTLQNLHSLIVTSPSPAEGKSFTAVNLALAQAHLAENPTLLVDLDLRRPVMHNLFQVDRSPGMTDYLLGKEPLHRVMKKVAGTNLYVIPAGSSVKNPLELLNLREVRVLFSQLPSLFNWVIMDTPPILFSADSNLLSTLADGTVLVVRIGETTIDSVTRAMQTLCENNVIGIVANGARAGELYYKYTYYYSRHEEIEDEGDEERDEDDDRD
jgi:receptor protein-tyrosine kinase